MGKRWNIFVKKKGRSVEHVISSCMQYLLIPNNKNKKKAVYIMVTLEKLLGVMQARSYYYQTTKDKSICHFRNKLNTNQPDFILGIVAIHRGCRFL